MTDKTDAQGKSDHTAKPITRRALIAGAAGLAGAAAVPGIAVPATRQQVPQDPTKVPGAPAAALGDRSSFERLRHLLEFKLWCTHHHFPRLQY